MMIKQLPSILLVGYIGLTLGGCGLFQKSEESAEKPPTDESAQPDEKKPGEVFEEPGTLPQTPQVSATDGLIPSTSPGERKKAINQGRDNPFAVIPIKPVVRQKTATNGIAQPEKLCKLEELKQPPTNVAQAPRPGVPVAAVPVSNRQPVSLREPILPIPNEARAVVVSGVLQLNGTPVAIVKAPNENVARHVRVGASLSNGQVRVKGIYVNNPKPYIVLEQYGLEIPRGLGEPAEEPVQPPQPPELTPPDNDGTQAPVAKTPKPPAIPSGPSPGPNSFGKINNVVLLKLNIGGNKANGIICNEGFQTLTVKELKLQVEDKTTGNVLDSLVVNLANGYTIQPSQRAEFDGMIPELRGRNQGDINIKLIGWS